MKSKKDLYLKLAITLFAVILAFCLIIIVMHVVETNLNKDNFNRTTFGEITYGDKVYTPKQRIKTFLLIGIDEFGEFEKSDEYANGKLADFITLFVFDENTETCTLVHINRDTMMEVPRLAENGNKAGVKYQQIALAHSYGSGGEDSGRNVANAVSSLLGDITVDNYMTLSMDAVAILNDMVGGVTVEIKDDFSAIDPSLKMGEKITLKGEQSLTYVRTRLGVGDQTNISRMARQKEYMYSFAESLKAAYEADHDLMIEIDEALGDYMITDSTVGELTELAELISNYELKGIVSPDGESKKGEMYMEYYVKKDALQKMIVDLFYEEKKS